MSYLGEIAAIILAVACAALWVLWRRERKAPTARDQLWRNALSAVAARDYEAAGAFAAMIEDESGKAASGDGKELFATLRGLMHTLESLTSAEAEERRARRGFEDVLASLQDGVLVVDGEARLRYLNAAALGLFGVRVEDVLGAQILEALPSFGLEAAVRQALEKGKFDAREVNLYTPRPREIFLRVAPVRQTDGTVSGAVAILQDLTEMRRLERVRRDFVANASHELRTPIATIRATAETLCDAGDDPELMRRFLPHLVSEAERLSRLVNDLLDLARAETRAESPDEMPRTPVDLCAVTRDVMEHLSDKARHNNVTVSCEAPAKAIVAGDAAGIEQVVFNLLDNALIYTPSGGSVKLKVCEPCEECGPGNGARQESLFADLPDGAAPANIVENIAENARRNARNAHAHYAMIAVRDTGIGIPAADLARIFERFYRVDKARSRAQGGTGLGLAIVKHIVESHDGYVEVESEVGQGTTFRVMLPADV